MCVPGILYVNHIHTPKSLCCFNSGDPVTLVFCLRLSPSSVAARPGRQPDDGTVSRRRLLDSLACDRWSWTKSTVGHKSPYVARTPNNTWPAAKCLWHWIDCCAECGRPPTRPITAATTTTDHRLCVEESRVLRPTGVVWSVKTLWRSEIGVSINRLQRIKPLAASDQCDNWLSSYISKARGQPVHFVQSLSLHKHYNRTHVASQLCSKRTTVHNS